MIIFCTMHAALSLSLSLPRAKISTIWVRQRKSWNSIKPFTFTFFFQQGEVIDIQNSSKYRIPTGELVNYAIAEHIENAGVHSGDASLLLPAQRLFVETHRRVKSISQKLCHLDWYFHRENAGTLLMVP